MDAFPPPTRHEMPGWLLFWADLEMIPCDPGKLAALRDEVTARVRASHSAEGLAEHPTVAGLRRLFRQAGCDPTRYRPSSEALVRRLLKGEAMPSISRLVDLNNCLSAELLVPVCVMDVRFLHPPFVFRAGRADESYPSLRGPFALGGKPLLVDAEGPADAPITGGERVRVREDTDRVWLVAYMPAAAVEATCGDAALRALLGAAPVARLRASGTTR